MSDNKTILDDLYIMPLYSARTQLSRLVTVVHNRGILGISINGRLELCILDTRVFDQLIEEVGGDAEERYCSELSPYDYFRLAANLGARSSFPKPMLIQLSKSSHTAVVADYSTIREIVSMLPESSKKIGIRTPSIQHALLGRGQR